jgi:RND family efflux transporter MFP subunit
MRWILLLLLAVNVQTWANAQQWSARGIVVPLHDVTMGVTVSGTVSAILKKEGASVTAGDPIVELRDDLQTLEAQRRRLIWQDRAQVEEAQQRLATLSDQLQRTRTLYQATHSVSKDELAKEELQVSLAQLEVQRLTAAEQQEEVNYEIAQAQVRQRTISAPFDGKIVKLSVDVGDACNPGQPVVRIVDAAQCRLVVHMDAAASRNFSVGMPVRVVVTGYGPQRAYDATIDYVSPVVDPSSGLREIKAIFPNPDGHVLPGLTGVMMPR